MYQTIHIQDHELGLWFRRGDFQQLLQPGTYRLWDAPWNFDSTKIEVVDLRDPRGSAHPLLDAMLEDHEAASLASV